jgi:hypothetical protein
MPSSNTPHGGKSLEVDKSQVRPKGNDEEVLEHDEVSYLCAIGALMYLANYIRPSIAFSIGKVQCCPNQKILGWHQDCPKVPTRYPKTLVYGS